MEPIPVKQKDSTVTVSLTLVYSVIAIIMGILFSAGAGKLSYDKYGSIGWAILAFLFGPFYYMYYAFFVSSSSASMFGGMRKMKW